MKGVIVPHAGAPFEVVDTLVKPQPGPKEILVKSLVAGMNPMENFMQGGLLVEGWPIVLGCDASGVVVDVGKDVTMFKAGDAVFGCVRVGFPGYMAFQEYFLMEEDFACRRPSNISAEQAATVSIGYLTASLALVSGLHLKLLEKSVHSIDSKEWVVVLGGAGIVGQCAIQIIKLNGLKVLASCSASNEALVKKCGADATFNYRTSRSEQLESIKSITGGYFSKVFDASAQSFEVGVESLREVAKSGDKYFATTNDWTPLEVLSGINTYEVHLGQLGRQGTAIADEVRTGVTNFLPKIGKLLESGGLVPLEFICAAEGFDGVLDGLKLLNEGKAKGKKIVVKLQEE